MLLHVRLTSASVATVVAMALAGCSSEEPAQTDDAHPEPSSAIGGPAPSEALAPAPDLVSRTDPEVLLGPEGDPDLLPTVVSGAVRLLQSVHMEQTIRGDDVDLAFDLVVDNDERRCSGTANDRGVAMDVVTTSDGRALVASPIQVDGEPGLWLETGYVIGVYCQTQLATVVFHGAGPSWPLTDARRVGVERVRGQRAVHYRKIDDGYTADTWIASRSTTTGARFVVLKYVTKSHGNTSTSYFDQFDSVGPVEPEPAADLVVPADQIPDFS